MKPLKPLHKMDFSLIAGFMADYEEQVLITGIKKAQHCSICVIPPHEQENLTKRWDDRTHEHTQWQIDCQHLDGVERSNETGFMRLKISPGNTLISTFTKL